MFPGLMKKKLALTPEECNTVLERCTSGVLGLQGTNGYPYTVPMSYAYRDGALWFHGAIKGYKMECMRQNPRGSFSVIDEDRVVPAERTSLFQSVNLFGTLRILTEDWERRQALEYLIQRFSPEYKEEGEGDIQKLWNVTATFVFEIEHMTGKASLEILEEQRKTR